MMHVLLLSLLLAGLCAVHASYDDYGYGDAGYGGYPNAPFLGGYGVYPYGGYGAGYPNAYGAAATGSDVTGAAAASGQAESSSSARTRSKSEGEGTVETVVRIFGDKERTCQSQRCQKEVRLFQTSSMALSST